MKTEIKITQFGKHPILEIYEEGETEKSIVSFGLKKAEAILASLEEIKKFVEENKK